MPPQTGFRVAPIARFGRAAKTPGRQQKGLLTLAGSSRSAQTRLMKANSPAKRSRFSRLMVPKTAAGWSCLASFGIGLLGFIIMGAVVGSGQEGGETFTDNWWISGPAAIAALGLVGSFAAGLLAIAWKRDRAIPVILATVIGALVTDFLIGEIFMPH